MISWITKNLLHYKLGPMKITWKSYRDGNLVTLELYCQNNYDAINLVDSLPERINAGSLRLKVENDVNARRRKPSIPHYPD